MPDQTQGDTVLPEHPCITPNVDRLASQGVTFRNAYCPAPHCCPSRASFQTGLYPSEHGVFNNVDTDTAIHANPYPGLAYFAQILRNNGYELDYTGKWHVGRNLTPWEAGWQNSYSKAPASASKFIPGLFRRRSLLQAAKSEMSQSSPRSPGEVMRPGWGNLQMYQTVAGTGPGGFEAFPQDYDPVTAGIEKVGRLAKTNRPWALMVSNNGAHDLYRATQNFVDMYDRRRIEIPQSFRDTLEDKPRIYQRMRYQYWNQMSDDEVRETLVHYYAKITMQDALFGLLLDALDKTGQTENTIVLYISDHGDYAAAHGLWAKGVPSFREAYSIPCVIRWPRGVAQPGRTVDAFVSTVDLAPTFLEAAGIPKEQYRMSGSSLLPWLRGKNPEDWRSAIFTQMNGVELYYTQRIVMTKDYKYVYNGFDYDELYDRRTDPHEMVNLAFPDVQGSRSQLETGSGFPVSSSSAWPPLPSERDSARQDLLTRMWNFAEEHKDQIFNSYLTVAMAPLGPGIIA